ncbi:hypothetical protein [Clostridium paraputrificum]|uniref:hypothetical protein n=1 Tax=Clostridium paraputrificum TaxID=29363 RepID=UPI00189E3972|nr:hypothetical protein [Clostridium paraputrificum]
MNKVNVSIIRKGRDITHVVLNNVKEATKLLDILNKKADEDNSWIKYNIEHELVNGELTHKLNTISIIVKYDKPLEVFLNDSIQAEITYKNLLEDKDMDDGVYNIVHKTEFKVGDPYVN